MGCNCNKHKNRRILPEFLDNPSYTVSPHNLFTDYSDVEKQIIAELLKFTADTVVINNNPDEEDLTTVPETDKVLKFKNKDYDPGTFSGYGRVFLRKNIQDKITVTNGTSVTTQINLLTQDMFESDGCMLDHTIFVLQYDYDLNNTCVELPDDSVLLVLGGSIKNGTLVLHNTAILNNFLNFDEVFPNVLFINNFKPGTTQYTNDGLYFFSGKEWIKIGSSKNSCSKLYKLYYGYAPGITSATPEFKYINTIEAELTNIPTVLFTRKEELDTIFKLYWIIPVRDDYYISIYTNGTKNDKFLLVDYTIIDNIKYGIFELSTDDNKEFDSEIKYIKHA